MKMRTSIPHLKRLYVCTDWRSRHHGLTKNFYDF
jgi:hypothetical protein